MKLNPSHTRASTISGRIPGGHDERKILTRISHDSILHRLIVTLPVAGLLFQWLMPLRNTGDANADSVLAALSIWAVSLVLQGLFTIRGFVWFPLNVILMVWLCSRLFDYSNPVEWVIQYALHILPEDVAAFQTEWSFSALTQETRTVILFAGWGIMVSAVHMLALYRRTVWLFGGSTLVYLAALEAALGDSVLMGMSRAVAFILLAQGVMLILALRQETISDSDLPFISRQSGSAPSPMSRSVRVPMLRWSLIVLLFSLLITGATRIWGMVSEPSEGMGMTVTEMAAQLGDWIQAGHKGAEASIPAAQITGYSSPDKDMGGPLTLSDELYFTAQSSVPTYWRGDTYRYYDGRRWDEDHNASRPIRMNEDLGGVLPYWQHAEGETLVQTLTFYQDTPARSLLAGGLITRVQNIRYSDERGMPRMTANRLSETVSIQGDVPIAGYTVESVYIAPQVELLRTAIGTDPHDLRTSYLQLPVSLPERVRDLAQEITKGTSNRYDAALAIENFLKQNYTYSLQTAVPPEGQDFVDDFLFDTGEGYCVHFATAMTVLLRAEGIPARYVTGFAPGERSVGKIDTYEIALKDAHAWVEVYFAEQGWVRFDPTPGYRVFDESTVPPVSMENPQANASQSHLSDWMSAWINLIVRVLLLIAAIGPMLFTGGILLIIPITAFILYLMPPYLRRMHFRRMARNIAVGPREALVSASSIVWDKLERRYGRLEEGQTVRQYIGSLTISDEALRRDILSFAQEWERAAYHNQVWSRTEKVLFLRQCISIVKKLA